MAAAETGMTPGTGYQLTILPWLPSAQHCDSVGCGRPHSGFCILPVEKWEDLRDTLYSSWVSRPCAKWGLYLINK